MEFERALFRIHQRLLYSEPGRHVRILAERWLPWVALGLAVPLASLHMDYVGQARCLPIALQHAGLWNESAGEPTIAADALVSLTIATEEDIDSRSGAGNTEAPTNVESSSLDGTADGVSPQNASALGSARLPETYHFAVDREIVLMRPATLSAHSFTIHNISVPESCLTRSSPILRTGFRHLSGGYDSLVINELAYSFRTRGYLERHEAGAKVEAWAWSAEQVDAANPAKPRSLPAALVRKAMLLFKAGITFMLISAVTGFFIRIAVNGSAVLMFPIALISQRLAAGRMPLGVLTRSFPWIGVHVELLRRSGRPLGPLFRSHLAFLMVQSFSYLACNLAWRFILYRKSTPEGFEERIFSFCSVIELFNLIFVRSQSSFAVFPKIAFFCMAALHFYVFAALYPFFSLALSLCACVCAYFMVYCLNNFEEPALRGDPFAFDTPTAAHPRSQYMPQLSPSWTLEAAPLWTMFYPPEPHTSYPAEAMRHIAAEEYMMP